MEDHNEDDDDGDGDDDDDDGNRQVFKCPPQLLIITRKNAWNWRFILVRRRTSTGEAALAVAAETAAKGEAAPVYARGRGRCKWREERKRGSVRCRDYAQPQRNETKQDETRWDEMKRNDRVQGRATHSSNSSTD